ncbi:THAP domain-containing protein [Ooceraea biroi]|uniref:THAP domain-containing protein n=1 Tax=Ooceraea biroi TaxID=2015173 RepID=A0A026VSS4_OOCBI|nr:THAP domain-containing protein [Ooceraea biroi]
MLRKWIGNYNCETGFLSEVFEYLETEVKQKQYLKDVALIFDAMAIRIQIVYDVKSDKNKRYIDHGGIVTTNSNDLATEVLVFQIVSYTNRFKCPIAYVFINKINADLQVHLIKYAIEKLYKTGIIVRSITCDGAKTNISTLRLLGCNFSIDNMKTSFKHPQNESNIYCILDPCHMIKLARNTFAESNLTSETGNISFSYIKQLHTIQETANLKLANRLSYNHVYFKNKKMNVRLAAQALSSAVADAIDYMGKSGYKDFANSEATVEFIHIFDRLFDMMNARQIFGTGFKSPMMIQNLELFKQYFDYSVTYISSLTIDGINILRHPRHTFALGFVINTKSFYNLAYDLLHKKENTLRYFLPYKCSQDHIELFFSCIRRRGGENNNPNVLQFKWALRQLLFRNSVRASINANCLGDTSETPSILKFRTPNVQYLMIKIYNKMKKN